MIGIVIGMWAASGALALLRDWRLTVPLLLVTDLLRVALLWQAAPLAAGRASLLLAELATALGVAAILLLTASRFAYTARFRTSGPALAVTLGSVVLAGAVAAYAAHAYPVSGNRSIDLAVCFGVLCGVLVLLSARDVLKLGVGLLLLAGSAKLLFFGTNTMLLVLHAGLWEALSLGLALVAAVFCSLLYGRLYTLEFGRLSDAE